MAPRGVPQVEVKFDIDANGILNVSATDKGSGQTQSIRITASTGLAKEEVERMKQEAEAHAADDAKKRELIEVRNLAEQMVYTSEKMLKDAGDKVTAEEKRAVEEKIQALRNVKDGEDLSVIKKAADELSVEAQKVGAKMYQEGNKQQAAGPGTTSGAGQSSGQQNTEGKKDGPIDAEFKDKGTT
jgi:molecular chaperone DnaK